MKTAPRIAVVDDEMIVAKDLESILRRLGYEVSGTAPSGQEAIALASEQKPDLVLMDIRLRGELDGIEAARQIQHQLDVPIVYVTAYADEATLDRARETHPYGYLVKPVQENALRSTVSTALNRHRAERQTRMSLKRQRALFDALGHLVWTAREDGRAEFFNQRWFDVTELTHGASRGYGWVTAIQPTDMHRCLSQWKEAVQRKEGFELVCSVKDAKSKRYRRHLMRVGLLSDAPGGPQWLATLTDIHDYELRPDASQFAEAGTLTAPIPGTGTPAKQAEREAVPTTITSPAEVAAAAPAAAGSMRPSNPATAAALPAQFNASETFRDRFCKASKCTAAQFTDRVLLLTLYFHALPVVVLLWPWRTRLFKQDFALIEHVATAQWSGDVQWQLERLRTPAWLGGLFRQFLRCRISTRRLGTLMGKLMDVPAEP